MDIIKNLISWISGKKSSEPEWVLALLEDEASHVHYRWVRLKDFRKSLKKNKIFSSFEFPKDLWHDASQILWVKQCPVIGGAYNLFKFYLKSGGFCHLRSKVSLGELLKKSKQVFIKDTNVPWSRITVIKFIPIGGLLYFDSRIYTLCEVDKELVVRRYLP